MNKFESEVKKNSIKEWGCLFEEIMKRENLNSLEAAEFMNKNYYGTEDEYKKVEINGVIHLFTNN